MQSKSDLPGPTFHYLMKIVVHDYAQAMAFPISLSCEPATGTWNAASCTRSSSIIAITRDFTPILASEFGVDIRGKSPWFLTGI